MVSELCRPPNLYDLADEMPEGNEVNRDSQLFCGFPKHLIIELNYFQI